jgi:hypothetical protein
MHCTLTKLQQHSWSNYATDMLECSHCHAKLCIAFDPALTPTQKQQVALFYQKQLVSTGHANDMCLFWDDDSKEQDGAVPLYLASVLDPDFVELLEHAAPHTVLLDRANRFAFFPQLMSTKVNPIKHRQDRLLFDRVKQKVRAGYTATLLSLLGWTCREENGGSPTKMMTLECKVCGSEFQGDVVSSHRYYCPWRCGFPQRGEPCWKLLANNIVAIDEEPDNESAKEDALVRLQVALNP